MRMMATQKDVNRDGVVRSKVGVGLKEGSYELIANRVWVKGSVLSNAPIVFYSPCPV